MKYVLDKVALAYYSALLGLHLCFVFMPDYFGFHLLDIEILSIYYHLFSGQVGICLVASLLYIISYQKVIQGKTEFYIFPGIILLIDCISTFSILRDDVSHMTWFGLTIKIIGIILFALLFFLYGKKHLFCNRKYFRGIALGLYYYAFCFLYSLIPYLPITVPKFFIYAIPIVIFLLSVAYIKCFCHADFFELFIISYLCWAAFSPLLSSPIYDLIKTIYPLSADMYLSDNGKYLLIYSSINFACWIIIFGFRWLKDKIQENTEDATQNTWNGLKS